MVMCMYNNADELNRELSKILRGKMPRSIKACDLGGARYAAHPVATICNNCLKQMPAGEVRMISCHITEDGFRNYITHCVECSKILLNELDYADNERKGIVEYM